MIDVQKITKTFRSNTILYADELNMIVGKINAIIDAASSGGSSTGGGSSTPSTGITESEVDTKIQTAINQLTALIDEAKARLNSRIDSIESAPSGSTFEYDEQHLLQLFKEVINGEDGTEFVNAVLLRMGAINEQGEPYFDTTVLQKINNLETKVSSLELLPAQISLLVEHKQDGTDAVKPAAIIAAITDNNGTLTSQIGLSADKIILDGTTLASKLSAQDAEISRLNAATANIDAASIKDAVVDQLTTGDLTITGTLHYNKIIGNVVRVSSHTTLPDDAYYVICENDNDPFNHIHITFPRNPQTGQTLFIGGTYYDIYASTDKIAYYYDNYDEDSGRHTILSQAINSGYGVSAIDCGWNGIVEFIYNGQAWQQLIHNIQLAN